MYFFAEQVDKVLTKYLFQHHIRLLLEADFLHHPEKINHFKHR